MLNEFYAKYWTEYKHDSPDLKEVSKKIQSQRYNRMLLELGTLKQLQGATLLDVGCGLGSFLARCMQLGAKVTGLDLDPASVSFCKEKLHIDDVSFGTIETLPKERRFDIITLSNVIEHPLEPLAMLAACLDHLNPGGLLAMITPNGDFSDPRFGPHVPFRVDLEHMQYFTARSFGYVVEKLKSIHIDHLETFGDPFLASMGHASKTGRKAPLMKRVAQKLPGFGRVEAMRNKMRFFDDRMGSYHFLCIYCKHAE